MSRSSWRGKRARKITQRGMTMTPRELEVSLLVERDLSNYEIARKLGITVGTVKFHVHNIFVKRGPRPRRAWKGAITAAGRERIREAQRRRWQRWRAARSGPGS